MERPHVLLSFAQGLDGSIGGPRGERIALSCPESLDMTRGLRASVDAILVGAGTVRADAPSLGLHGFPGRPPRPVVIDGSLSVGVEARVYARRESRPVAICRPGADRAREAALRAGGVEVLKVEPEGSGRIPEEALLRALWGIGVASVMVEGGAKVIGGFLRSGLVDELVITLCPLAPAGVGPWRGAAEYPPFRLDGAAWERRGSDMVLRGRPLFG